MSAKFWMLYALVGLIATIFSWIVQYSNSVWAIVIWKSAIISLIACVVYASKSIIKKAVRNKT